MLLRPIDGYEPGKPLTIGKKGRSLADYWSGLLDASLADLGTDHVDAYYLMGVGEPEVVRCEELHEAFLKAKQAGKVGHWGVSTHKRAQQVLEAMIGTDWYDLAMIAITPAGQVRLGSEESPSRHAGDGRASAHAAARPGRRHWSRRCEGGPPRSSRGGKDLENVFDGHYSDELMRSGLSPWQRSYAFVHAHGVDVVNSDTQNFAHFKENLAAVQRSAELFVRA